MKRKYYVHYYSDFGNTYRLYHAPADFTPPPEWERIARREAEALARAERRRRRTDPASAYYADNFVYPHDFNDDEYWSCPKKFTSDGVILRRK